MGLRLAKFPEAIEFDQHIDDDLEAGAEVAAYKIVRRVELPVG